MEKTISLFLAILTLGFAQQILAQDANASADESERWSDFLPLNKEMAGDADLPLPFGIGVTGFWQEQDMKTKSDIGFVLDARALGAGVINATATSTNVESEVDNLNVRVDGWLFPFLNVYGVYGEVDGENTASGLGLDAVTAATLAGARVTIPDSFTFSYDGNVYGFGLILAGQWGKYWGTLDYNFIRADLSISTSEIDTRTITPRIGTSGTIGSTRGSLWIGAMHQDIDEKQIGNILFPATVGLATINLPVSYDVRLEQVQQWNFLLGGSAELSEKVLFSIEGGIGDRKQVMGNLTFRF